MGIRMRNISYYHYNKYNRSVKFASKLSKKKKKRVKLKFLESLKFIYIANRSWRLIQPSRHLIVQSQQWKHLEHA